MKSDNNWVWLDLEMTGLDHNKERIIEIATIVTDNQLNILAQGPVLAIHQSDELMDGMDSWNTKQHNQSGLVERVKNSAVTEASAEQQTLEFIKQFVPKGMSPMCGNSIGTDRRFLVEYMPELEAYFHYRNLDVSTLKILANHWAPQVMKDFEKDSQHLALQDIKDSIDELKYYRERILKV